MAKAIKAPVPTGGPEVENETPAAVPETGETKSIHDLMGMAFTTDVPGEIVQLRPSSKPGLYEFFRVQ